MTLQEQIEKTRYYLVRNQIANEIEAFKKTLKPDEIATSVVDFNPKKTKLIDGNANFYNSQIKDLGTLTSIGNSADFRNSIIENLGNLTTIGGDVDFRDSKVENLGNLTTIVGYAYFNDSQVKNLRNLTTIGGNAVFSNSIIKDLGNLTTIGGTIYANGNKLTKEQIELHLKKINEINIIKKGLYYILNGKVFIKPSVLVDNQYFFVKDLKFNDNGIIGLK